MLTRENKRQEDAENHDRQPLERTWRIERENLSLNKWMKQQRRQRQSRAIAESNKKEEDVENHNRPTPKGI